MGSRHRPRTSHRRPNPRGLMWRGDRRRSSRRRVRCTLPLSQLPPSTPAPPTLIPLPGNAQLCEARQGRRAAAMSVAIRLRKLKRMWECANHPRGQSRLDRLPTTLSMGGLGVPWVCVCTHWTYGSLRHGHGRCRLGRWKQVDGCGFRPMVSGDDPRRGARRPANHPLGSLALRCSFYLPLLCVFCVSVDSGTESKPNKAEVDMCGWCARGDTVGEHERDAHERLIAVRSHRDMTHTAKHDTTLANSKELMTCAKPKGVYLHYYRSLYSCSTHVVLSVVYTNRVSAFARHIWRIIIRHAAL